MRSQAEPGNENLDRIAVSEAEKVNILVVDDLQEKLLVYETVLESLNQNVMTAHSGEEALRLVLQHDFAVILLDVNMPGIDGFETAALIRQRKKSAHTPIIFITAFADELRIAEGYAQGAVDYILAPVVADVLRAKVKVFVDLFQMAQQVKRQAEERVALAEERNKRAAAEEANRHLSFLTRAGSMLGQSLDYHSTVTDLARLAGEVDVDLAGGCRRAMRFIDQDRARARVPDDPFDLLGRQPRVHRREHQARRARRIPRSDELRAIAGDQSDAIALPHTGREESRQNCGGAPRDGILVENHGIRHRRKIARSGLTRHAAVHEYPL